MAAIEAESNLEGEFERNGFILLKDAIAKKEVLSLREFLTAELERHEAMADSGASIQTGTTPCRAIWPDFYQANPDWFRIFCSARIVITLHRLLGDPFVLTRDSIAHWGYFPDWHTDTTTSEFAGKSSHREPGWRMLTAGIYLQAGAGLSVVPGSHRAPDPFVEMRKNRGAGGLAADPAQWTSPDTYDIPVQPGDVVLFDMRLIHRASRTPPLTSASEPCEKIAVFSRVSRNYPGHLADYSDYRFNGAGVDESNLPQLRELARQRGFLVA